MELRVHTERVENHTKKLCCASACPNTIELYSTVIDIFTKLKAGEEKVIILENKLVEMDERIAKAKQIKNALCFNVKQEDIEMVERIEHLKKQIELELQAKELVAYKTKTVDEQIFQVQFAMQHLVNLLRNVYRKRPMFRKEYPNEVLSLPLHKLHLVSYEDRTTPPDTVEEDINELFKAIFERVAPLMKEFLQIRTLSETFVADCERRHEHLVLGALSESENSSEKFN